MWRPPSRFPRRSTIFYLRTYPGTDYHQTTLRMQSHFSVSSFPDFQAGNRRCGQRNIFVKRKVDMAKNLLRFSNFDPRGYRGNAVLRFTEPFYPAVPQPDRHDAQSLPGQKLHEQLECEPGWFGELVRRGDSAPCTPAPARSAPKGPRPSGRPTAACGRDEGFGAPLPKMQRALPAKRTAGRAAYCGKCVFGLHI